MSDVKKDRKPSAERVKLSDSQKLAVLNALSAYKEQVLADVSELDPTKHARFIKAANDEANELADLFAKFTYAGYIAYTVGE